MPTRSPWLTTLLLVSACSVSVADSDGAPSPLGHWALIAPPGFNASCRGEVEFLADGTIERFSELFSAVAGDPPRDACVSLPRWERAPDDDGATRVTAQCADGRDAWVDFRLIPTERVGSNGFELEVVDAVPRDVRWFVRPLGTWVRCRNDETLACPCAR